MTVEPSYTENELRRVGAEYNLLGFLDRVIRRSSPDPRLQAITNAWNDVDGSVYDEVRFVAPKLFGLLDALTEEDNDAMR